MSKTAWKAYLLDGVRKYMIAGVLFGLSVVLDEQRSGKRALSVACWKYGESGV